MTLIAAIRAGRTELYVQIVQAYQQPLYRYCCRLLTNRQDAEDAVQDILVKAYRSLNRYEDKERFAAWLYRIAYRHCLNLLRRRRLHTRVLRFWKSDDTAAGPEQELDNRLYSPALAAALAKLSAEELNLLVLRVFEEKSFAEIGEILNASPNALTKRMNRIRLKIRRAMKNEEEIEWNERSITLKTKI